MNERKAILFLFSITKEIEESFQCPVIFFTEIDYANYNLISLMDMQTALQQNANPSTLVDIVNTFHLKWLKAIQDLEMFQKRLKNMPREVILKAIDYTLECLEARYKFLCNYVPYMQSCMTKDEKRLLNDKLYMIAQIKEINLSTLLEKQKKIQIQADQTEYLNILHDELEELLIWLDKINSNLALHLSYVLDLKAGDLLQDDLKKTLQQIIEQVSDNSDLEAQRIADLFHSKTKAVDRCIRINSAPELVISKIDKKVRDLESRVSMLSPKNSTAVLALQHKTIYLEERLESLENIKFALHRLKKQKPPDENDRIFNHILPHAERCKLVERMVKLWNSAILDNIHNERGHESLITILSVTNITDTFTDTRGKLYRKDKDDELVAVEDDYKHVYCYDECGPYYLDATKHRVYTAHADASEYLLNTTENLLKVKEIKNGIEYFYDWLGQFYINKDGKRIYCDENDTNVYEDDGLDNFSKSESKEYIYRTYAEERLPIEATRYLQEVVGPALKKCIADVILHQPIDPIKYLAKSLIKYRENIELRRRRLDDEHKINEKLILLSMTNDILPLNHDEKYVTDEKSSKSSITNQDDAIHKKKMVRIVYDDSLLLQFDL